MKMQTSPDTSKSSTTHHPLVAAEWESSFAVIHREWYISLALQFIALLCVTWYRQTPFLTLWLAFDIFSAVACMWADHINPHGPLYSRLWTFGQPVALALRITAARETWGRFEGRSYSAACTGMAALIYLGRAQKWPASVIELLFALTAISCAALGFILVLTINAASKSKDRRSGYRAMLMAGYFVLLALCYLVAGNYRDLIGRATGIVASLYYGGLCLSFVRHG
jgi:hypothetical protein